MRYTLHAPGNPNGDVTQVGWNSGRKRKIIVTVPVGGAGIQPANPVVYVAHTRMELAEQTGLAGAGSLNGGIAVTPANSPFIFHDWTGDCYAVSSPDGVAAIITSEEEHSPDWNQKRDG